VGLNELRKVPMLANVCLQGRPTGCQHLIPPSPHCYKHTTERDRQTDGQTQTQTQTKTSSDCVTYDCRAAQQVSSTLSLHHRIATKTQHTHTHTHTKGQRESARARGQKRHTRTHTHTHTERERERETFLPTADKMPKQKIVLAHTDFGSATGLTPLSESC